MSTNISPGKLLTLVLALASLCTVAQADTFSSVLGWLQMATGNDNNSWGTNHNNQVSAIFEDAIAAKLTSAVTGGTLDLSGADPDVYAALVNGETVTLARLLPDADQVRVSANALEIR